MPGPFPNRKTAVPCHMHFLQILVLSRESLVICEMRVKGREKLVTLMYCQIGGGTCTKWSEKQTRQGEQTSEGF